MGYRMKNHSDSEWGRWGREREREAEGMRERGRQGQGAGHTGRKRQKTGNRPERLWGGKREMQIHTKRWRRKKPRWPAGQRETGKKEAQGAGKRGNKESKRRGRMTETEREMENRERGDREQSTIPERKRVTWKQKKLHRGKGEGAVRDWDTEEG